MKKRTGQILIIALGVILIAAGIYSDEVKIIFTKAVNICLECVGIG